MDALVENAIRYSAQGSPSTVTAGPDGSRSLDRGPGMEPGEEEACSSGFTADAPADGCRGTGLGLPIARELAREWGGNVTIANRTGGGLAATITLDPDTQDRDWSR